MPQKPVAREGPVRPAYHYTPRMNWLSDPNGLVHDGCRWHMFYQYNPQGEDWGHMSWGHCVSNDLARWQELEPALLDDAHEMVFSGSAVIDQADHAGFGPGAMVAFYTAALAVEPPVQAQSVAYSNDGGIGWMRFAGNPVIDLGMADFRDPYVFRHEASEAWIMVVVKSCEQTAQIYRSENLINWRLASEISAGPAPGRVWECPTMVELPVESGTGTRWLFKVDALHDAPGAVHGRHLAARVQRDAVVLPCRAASAPVQRDRTCRAGRLHLLDPVGDPGDRVLVVGQVEAGHVVALGGGDGLWVQLQYHGREQVIEAAAIGGNALHLFLKRVAQ